MNKRICTLLCIFAVAFALCISCRNDGGRDPERNTLTQAGKDFLKNPAAYKANISGAVGIGLKGFSNANGNIKGRDGDEPDDVTTLMMEDESGNSKEIEWSKIGYDGTVVTQDDLPFCVRYFDVCDNLVFIEFIGKGSYMWNDNWEEQNHEYSSDEWLYNIESHYGSDYSNCRLCIIIDTNEAGKVYMLPGRTWVRVSNNLMFVNRDVETNYGNYTFIESVSGVCRHSVGDDGTLSFTPIIPNNDFEYESIFKDKYGHYFINVYNMSESIEGDIAIGHYWKTNDNRAIKITGSDYDPESFALVGEKIDETTPLKDVDENLSFSHDSNRYILTDGTLFRINCCDYIDFWDTPCLQYSKVFDWTSKGWKDIDFKGCTETLPYTFGSGDDSVQVDSSDRMIPVVVDGHFYFVNANKDKKRIVAFKFEIDGSEYKLKYEGFVKKDFAFLEIDSGWYWNSGFDRYGYCYGRDKVVDEAGNPIVKSVTLTSTKYYTFAYDDAKGLVLNEDSSKDYSDWIVTMVPLK